MSVDRGGEPGAGDGGRVKAGVCTSLSRGLGDEGSCAMMTPRGGVGGGVRVGVGRRERKVD